MKNKQKAILVVVVVIIAACLFEAIVVLPTARQARNLGDYGSLEKNKLALSRDPNDAAAHRGMASYYLAQPDLERAEVHLRTAVRLMPQDRNSAYQLALVLERKGEQVEARKIYSDLLTTNSKDYIADACRARMKKMQAKGTTPAT